MGTFERFQDALKNGTVNPDGGEKLSAQLRYDYLAAVHTMEQIMNLEKEFKSRKERREKLLEKISASCRKSLKNIVDSEGVFTLKQIDAAITGLQECRSEILKLEHSEKIDGKLSKIIIDGVSAGR
ncbi:MAG: hypothetical protein IJS29_00065 [Selenomonadaceae bacterium]|nr:hypothetical protein [Selenomonadaceae bacterium]